MHQFTGLKAYKEVFPVPNQISICFIIIIEVIIPIVHHKNNIKLHNTENWSYLKKSSSSQFTTTIHCSSDRLGEGQGRGYQSIFC